MKKQHPIYRGHIPFVRFLLALATGIGTAYAFVPQQSLYTLAWVILVTALVAFMGIACITRLQQYRYYGPLGFLILLSLASTGWILTWQPHPQINQMHFSHYESKALVGYVADEPVRRGSHVRFPLTITKGYDKNGITNMSGGIMLTVHVGDTVLPIALDYGDELIIPAQYRVVPPPYNPGEMDYKSYLANKNLWHQLYVQSGEIQKIGAGRGNPLVGYALGLRQRMVAKFSQYIPDKDALSIASTLILGYRASMSQELLQAFSTTGTIHVLCVSGMHVVMVFWLLSKLLWWMDRGKNLRVVKFFVLLMCVWGYALLTGFSPSVLRASIMISFVMAASGFSQQARIYNSIAASAFFLLLYNPKFIAELGFQLSYLAVLGIVFLLPKLQVAFSVNNRLAKPVCDYTLLSISAQAGAGPLAAYYFHQFPLYFLPANLFVVLPASGIMYLGFALLLLPPGQLASWIGYVLEKLIVFTNGVLSHIEHLPMASINGIWLDWWEEILAYGLILTITLATVMRNKGLVYGTLGCSALLILSSFSGAFRRLNQQEVVIFNIRRDMAVGFISRKQAWIYSSRPSMDDRTIQYSVLPKLEASVPASDIHFIQQDSVYVNPEVYIKEDVLQLGDTRLMIYDGKKSYDGQLEVDILLLRNNPWITLEKLSETVTCKQLILDESNYDSTIQRFQSEANAIGLPAYVLKHNFAYVWGVKK
ncbi:ComEC/Rec2 family competence protein [Parapedobacter tibetensis]|uniref:ComEC/Rec2 family competence protein n=1 Tax=Parapedobacter tibetensis TaxID=2972951 RepID=UPI00214D453F|nr:ComEC/Rec2 family competence protein [Parapedobacter tibetensis]